MNDKNNPPFKIGDHIRMKKDVKSHPTTIRAGVIKKLSFHKYHEVTRRIHPDLPVGYWWGAVTRLGKKYKVYFNPNDWELIPDGELSLDQAGASLAREFLAGNKSALLPLVDRILELVNRPITTEVTGEKA